MDPNPILELDRPKASSKECKECKACTEVFDFVELHRHSLSHDRLEYTDRTFGFSFAACLTALSTGQSETHSQTESIRIREF